MLAQTASSLSQVTHIRERYSTMLSQLAYGAVLIALTVMIHAI
jgi:hypothetical protein